MANGKGAAVKRLFNTVPEAGAYIGHMMAEYEANELGV